MTATPTHWRERLTEKQSSRIQNSQNRSIEFSAGLDFCSNDYLGLKSDPRLIEATLTATRKYGTGSGGARLLRGNSPLHEELEYSLAKWKGTESCLLLNSGYQANTSLITALLGSRDAIFSDSLNHASIIDGCRMARAKGTQLFIFDHLNLDHLNLLLSDWHKKRTQGALALVVTDAVFSMDGDLANLQALLSLCNDFDALLMVDEAHATGLLGESGAGLVEYQGIKGYVPVIMGTLGKALGSFGAFVCGDSLLTDHLINTCRGFIFSTALPAPVVASALKAVEIAQTECWRRLKALENARIIREALGQKRSDSAIISVLIGDNGQTLQEAARLRAHGFDIRAIRPPTVPEGTARLRITTNALQQEKDIKALIQLLLPHNESGL